MTQDYALIECRGERPDVDGVAEAQSPSGELFGFERTAAISTQFAEAIAHAAQSHGQEDDITVLTLSFASVEVTLGA